MRRLLPLLLAVLAGLSACDSPNDPNDPGSTPDRIAVAQIGDMPFVGGNVTSVSLAPDGSMIALSDGILEHAATPGAPMRPVGHAGGRYIGYGAAPNGRLYGITETEIHVFDDIEATPRTSPIDPAGPLAQAGRVEAARVDFSPSGEAFITMISNYPRMYLYRGGDDGTTWTEIELPSSVYMSQIAFGPDGTLYAAGSQAFHVSTDEGATWQTRPPVVQNYHGAVRVMTDGTIFYWLPGIGSLHVSRDGGSSFTQLTGFNVAPFPIDIREGAGGDVVAIFARSGANDAHVPGWVSRSTDGGTTWTKILNANARALAVDDGTIVVGLAGDRPTMGGVYYSTDEGETWRANGLLPAQSVSDIAFDRTGALLAIVDGALLRKTSGGWNVLGSQGRSYSKVAANSTGSIVVASSNFLYSSTDDGRTWRDSAITDYVPGSSGSVIVASLIARSGSGNFLMSIGTNDNAGNGFHAGALYSIGAIGGGPERVQGVAYSLRSLVEDRNGVLYGSEERLDPISQTFSTTLYRSQGTPTLWEPAPQGARSGSSYNSSNRYVRVADQDGMAIGTTGGSEQTFTIEGLPVAHHLLGRVVFGPDDRLYMTTLEGGVYVTEVAVR